MNHRVWVPGVFLLGLLGCLHQQTRLQSEDEADRDKDAEVRTLGEVINFSNADPIPVSGVGLVTDLDGTGGSAPPSGFRTLLEDYLRKRGVENIKELLASPHTSLVLVSALIPPGARKGDPLDIEVTLPPQSKTTSLRGGYLRECVLYNYSSTKNVAPTSAGGDRPLMGHPVAKAEGRLLVGFGDGDEAARLRQGRIWGGGRCKIDRPFYLVLNDNQQYARIAGAVAERINDAFHGGPSPMAVAQNNAIIFLNVPAQYRHNQPRYLRVVRAIPLEPVPARSPYRRRLEEQLLDPARALPAALRLEALGADSVAALKRGLQSEHPLVRFAAAEALAYLGSPACGEELARAIEGQPALRAFGLTALASLDEAVSHVKLRELLAAPAPETRYGAFRALRALDEREPNTQGELLNDSFWLHLVCPESPPLVHLSSSRRAEIVLFGEPAMVLPPFSFLAGPEFTVTAGPDDDRCTISRFSVQRGTRRKQCSLRLDDVLRTLAELGGTYPDAVELLQQAGRCQSLSCALKVDALPQAVSVHELARDGSGDLKLLLSDHEIVPAKADFGATPNLFAKGTSRRTPTAEDKDNEAALRDDKRNGQKKTAERKGKALE
jgi:hypothetical protein